MFADMLVVGCISSPAGLSHPTLVEFGCSLDKGEDEVEPGLGIGVAPRTALGPNPGGGLGCKVL